jgi:hypothetical protein
MRSNAGGRFGQAGQKLDRAVAATEIDCGCLTDDVKDGNWHPAGRVRSTRSRTSRDRTCETGDAELAPYSRVGRDASATRTFLDRDRSPVSGAVRSNGT